MTRAWAGKRVSTPSDVLHNPGISIYPQLEIVDMCLYLMIFLLILQTLLAHFKNLKY